MQQILNNSPTSPFIIKDILKKYDEKYNAIDIPIEPVIKTIIIIIYHYDAWGRLLTNIPNDDTILGINRFVYKGYYLDTETGWYYLKSRYYDPNTCRFINADGMAYFNPYNVMGANLFVYCLNNPIMNYDPNGNFVIISA